MGLSDGRSGVSAQEQVGKGHVGMVESVEE